ncbi:MAG: peptide-methionine (S)-S-oxide reductase MsrA [Solirubrobacterales bacterium]
MAKAMFGAGCFWGVEETFRAVEGVQDVTVGYSGGDMPDPGYEAVCRGDTGHAEVVLVEYDPAQVDYERLVDVFWEAHDPTQVNRQGPDHGTQYRSAIFAYDDEQKRAAEQSKQDLDASGRLSAPVATEIASASEFWKAEDYHQQYFRRRGRFSPQGLMHRLSKH